MRKLININIYYYLDIIYYYKSMINLVQFLIFENKLNHYLIVFFLI